MTNTMKYKASNIIWDTDGDEEIFNSLPSEVIVEVTDDEDVIDTLSDEYGFCIFSATVATA